MDLNAWAAIATIIQAIFLPVSLFFVWYQLMDKLIREYAESS